jgi:hypothetical protein
MIEDDLAPPGPGDWNSFRPDVSECRRAVGGGGTRMAIRLQLISGEELLDEWAATASQAARNALYEALFAIGDGSAFLIYDIFGDGGDPQTFIILVKPELVVKVRVNRAESSFEIRYVGRVEEGSPAAAAVDHDES